MPPGASLWVALIGDSGFWHMPMPRLLKGVVRDSQLNRFKFPSPRRFDNSFPSRNVRVTKGHCNSQVFVAQSSISMD
jgi:hypothetical protein